MESSQSDHIFPRKTLSGARILWWGRVAITLGLVVYLVLRQWPQLEVVRFRLIQPSHLGLAVGLAIIGVLLSTWLWRSFIPAGNLAPFRHLLVHYLVGMLWNNFLPGGVGGDAVRVMALRSSTGRVEVAVSSVLMSRLASLWSISLMATGAALFHVLRYGFNSSFYLLFLSGSALVAITCGTVFLFDAPMEILMRYLPERWTSWHARLRDYCITPVRLLKALGYAFAIQTCAVGINILTAQALGLPIAAWKLWLSLPLITLVSMLPISIGGFGVRENSYVFLLGLLDVSAAEALVLSLVVYAVLLMVTVSGAGICLLSNSLPGLRSSVSRREKSAHTGGLSRASRLIKRVMRPPEHPATPTDLLFFVTDRCNLRCDHCFYRYAVDASSGTDGLGLNEIERIIGSLREPLRSLVLTGGEPFLRHDLSDICALFNTIRRPDMIVLPTNGLLTEQIASQVERICALGVPHLLVQVSLDGLAATHDAIRRQDGLFERAIATAGVLQKLQKSYRCLEVAIVTTISQRNINELEALAAYVHDEIALPHSFEVVRGSHAPLLTSLAPELASPAHPLDTGSQPLSPDELSALYPRLKQVYRRNTHLLTGDHPLWTALATAYRVGRYQHLVEVIKHRRPFRCPAGEHMGVIYPNGDVALCELSRPIGNLATFNYDLHALWVSEPAQAMRTHLRRCFCTHGCFQTVAMMREPVMVGRMALAAIGYLLRGWD